MSLLSIIIIFMISFLIICFNYIFIIKEYIEKRRFYKRMDRNFDKTLILIEDIFKKLIDKEDYKKAMDLIKILDPNKKVI